MALQFMNTLGNTLQEFIPIQPGKVGMYTCGPTVYDYAHIGNFRAYIFEDVLRRYLEFSGYDVLHIMNLTDVEDKTIAAANAAGVSIFEHSEKFAQAFFEDIETLGIRRAHHYPRATDFVPEMIDIIEALETGNHTYLSDGSVYFRISTFPEYGKLSGIRPDSVHIGARIDADEYEKEDARDFVLWKGWKEGEPKWESPWGDGRPGWHIECSAMSKKFLGNHFDIHCGGEDNIFPHHENEIAQSEAANHEPFVNFWLHCRHLMVNGEKMSKSKGNFFTLRQLIDMGHKPRAIRYLLLSAHYRQPLNLTMESLEAAERTVRRLLDFQTRMREAKQTAKKTGRSPEVGSILKTMMDGFQHHMDHDLDMPQALSVVFDAIRDINRYADTQPLSADDGAEALTALDRIDSVLNVLTETSQSLNEEIELLIQERLEARKNKNYARADEIRDTLRARGIILEDKADGTRWKQM